MLLKRRLHGLRLLKFLSLVWIFIGALILYAVIRAPNSSRTDVYRRMEEVEHNDVMIRSEPMNELSLSEDVKTKNMCLYVTYKQEIFEAAWPRKAVPGDLGYGGAGIDVNISLLTDTEKKRYDLGLKNYQVNQIASDMLPLRRDITLDMPECKNLSYDTSKLPTVGIVLIFYDEMWSALMRTVFSILDAGPRHLITEIILVDDESEREHLGKPLDDYIKIFHGIVKVVRMPTRKGLIAARMAGFQHVTGDAVVFLDAHCEVHKGWLEPLLHRIQQNENVVAVPNTDVLNWNTFKYEFTANKFHSRCGFDLDMKYSWIKIPEPDGSIRKSWADPVETPVHMGCCLATTTKNFKRLGGYDTGLEIWGCENLELSFKTWMCGGRLEVIPCSHIAHMYRPYFPYSWGSKSNVYQRNCLRVAEVWMDQYKIFYQDRVSNLQNNVSIGDVSQRKALREKLKCRSFDWYMKAIHPDLYLPTNTTAIGRIASIRDASLCIQKALGETKQKLTTPGTCNPWLGVQYFYLTREKQIRRDKHCLSYDSSQDLIFSQKCETSSTGEWEYTQENMIRFSGKDRCISLSIDHTKIIMAVCNGSDTRQQWNWPRKSLVLT